MEVIASVGKAVNSHASVPSHASNGRLDTFAVPQQRPLSHSERGVHHQMDWPFDRQGSLLPRIATHGDAGARTQRPTKTNAAQALKSGKVGLSFGAHTEDLVCVFSEVN
jgi:hypothetical protein